ncbi:MAG: lipoate--protein ligase [Oscillospiraceae bacterium]|nr:lipoate--protein ligase [Oscillospiraceae bacterium]
MNVLETGTTDPYYNLAFEEYVLNTFTQGDILILWQNDRTVVIGRNQCAEAEIDPDYIRENGVNVVRRATGGGAVYHDLGNLNYSFITDRTESASDPVNRCTKTVVDALRGLGLDAEASGRNDILVEGHKVSGTAQRILGSRILYHGTLLFSADLDAAERALRVDPEKFAGKGIASVRSRIANISTFLETPMTVREFRDYIKKALSKEESGGISLSPEDIRAIRRLKQEKYETWEWNYGRSPQMDVHVKNRWKGGTLELYYSVKRGAVKEICFRGDFLAMCPLKDITDALTGCRFTKEDVGKILDGFDLKDYFGTIGREEILSTMFENSAGS